MTSTKEKTWRLQMRQVRVDCSLTLKSRREYGRSECIVLDSFSSVISNLRCKNTHFLLIRNGNVGKTIHRFFHYLQRNSLFNSSLSSFLVITLRQRFTWITKSRCQWFDLLYHSRWHLHHQNSFEKRSTISSRSSSWILYEFNTKSVYTIAEILRSLLLSEFQ